jgi:hypothetical protein
VFAVCITTLSNVSQRYSPDLQKKALANREQRQEDFDKFVGQLKELSKSDKPSKSPMHRAKGDAAPRQQIADDMQSGQHRRKRMRSSRLRQHRLAGTSVMHMLQTRGSCRQRSVPALNEHCWLFEIDSPPMYSKHVRLSSRCLTSIHASALVPMKLCSNTCAQCISPRPSRVFADQNSTRKPIK